MRHWAPRGPCQFIVMVLFLSSFHIAISAQTIEMTADAVSSGGSPGSGGSFKLNGTVGQGSGIGRLSGGSFNKNVGFWYAKLSEIIPGGIDTLLITQTASDSALLTWTSDPYADTYRVYRSSIPYLDASGTPWTSVTPPDTTLIIDSGIGDTSLNYAYRVAAWSTGGLGNGSNTVGDFDFSSTGTLLKEQTDTDKNDTWKRERGER